MSPPILFLSFANSPNQPLHFLKKESESIYKIMLPAANQQDIQIHLAPYATIDNITNYLIGFKNRVRLFHYGGHANSESLFLDGEIAYAKGIARLLAQQKSLKLVFLNGCSTFKQVKLLLDLDIPAVIATSIPINDKSATRFAITFYEALMTHDTIQAAFNKAAAVIMTSTQKSPKIYPRGLGKFTKKNNTLPWGLYTLNDNKILEEVLIPKRKKFKGCIVIIVLTILISITSGVLYKTYDFPEKKSFEQLLFNHSIKIKGGLYKIGNSKSTFKQLKIDTTILISTFRIGKYEVTEAEYANFIIETKHASPRYWHKKKPNYFLKSKMPIVEVSWQDATFYCQWLQQKLEVKEVRLPTEIEWEIAANGNDSTFIYPWGNKFPENNFVHFGANQAIAVNHPSFSPSKFGLMHMGGNVEEWCTPSSNNREPICKKEEKIVKGGAFNSEPEEMLCIAGRCLPADHTAKEIGFRVVIIE